MKKKKKKELKKFKNRGRGRSRMRRGLVFFSLGSVESVENSGGVDGVQGGVFRNPPSAQSSTTFDRSGHYWIALLTSDIGREFY